jgi:hypothetical protein
MSYAPQALLDLRAYLEPVTGLSANDLGIVGDTSHNGGYHDGWDRRRLVDGELHDYSWQESTRDSGHKTDAGSAFDVGMFAHLRELSIWCVKQCEANAPDTHDIREIIYSPDGIVVKRFDRLGKRASGDSSHLKHSHFSYFRDAETRDKTALFRRFFEGEGKEMLAACKIGDTGQAVVDLQTAVIAKGGNLSDVGGADGVYGKGTARELAKFTGDDGTIFGVTQLMKLLAAGVTAGATPTEVTIDSIVGPIKARVTAVG